MRLRGKCSVTTIALEAQPSFDASTFFHNAVSPLRADTWSEPLEEALRVSSAGSQDLDKNSRLIITMQEQ